MSELGKLIADYQVDVQFPEVSGFEILELLDLRSDIAEREHDLTTEERVALEGADRRLIQNGHLLYESISQICNLAEMRQRANALPSHWWWYLDVLADFAKVAA